MSAPDVEGPPDRSLGRDLVGGPPTAAQFTIGRLMMVVAVAAGIFALLRLPGVGATPVVSSAIIALISLTTLYPARFKQPGRALLVATWAASLWPLSIITSLHVAWVIAYGALGHPPGQGDNGRMIELLTLAVFLCIISSLVSTVACFCLPLGATTVARVEDRRWNPQVLPVLMTSLAWLVVNAVLQWDPVWAMDWFID